MNKGKLLILLLVIGVIAFLLTGVSGNMTPESLTLSGNFELDEVILSFRVPGLISQRLVSEGDRVASGALIAKLDPEEYRIAVEKANALLNADIAALKELENGARPEEKAQAQAQFEMAQATLQQMESGLRPQERKTAQASLSQAKAMVEKARSSHAEAENDAVRSARLYAENAVSEKDYIAVRTREETARAAYNEAKARYESAVQGLSMANEGVRTEEIARARAAAKAAEASLQLVLAGPRAERIARETAKKESSEASLKQAEIALSYTSLTAPISGTIIAKAAEAGEFVKQGQPVVTIGNLEQIYLRAYVSETRFGLVKIGQPVKIKVDSFPHETFAGKIIFINQEAEFTPKTVQTNEERVKLVYRLKISVENPEQKLKPGMPADAVLEL